MLLGAALFLVGYAAGRARSKQRQRDPNTCQCRHALSFHSPAKGNCAECGCRRYIGPEYVPRDAMARHDAGRQAVLPLARRVAAVSLRSPNGINIRRSA